MLVHHINLIFLGLQFYLSQCLAFVLGHQFVAHLTFQDDLTISQELDWKIRLVGLMREKRRESENLEEYFYYQLKKGPKISLNSNENLLKSLEYASQSLIYKGGEIRMATP